VITIAVSLGVAATLAASLRGKTHAESPGQAPQYRL
jgi:hypothetical protein